MTGTDPLAQLLAVLILLCGFGLLIRQRIDSQIALLRAQAGALAATAAWTAHLQKAPQPLLAAVIILALQVVLLPAVLRRIAPRFGAPTADQTFAPPLGLAPGLALGLALGLLLLVLALLLAPLALAVPLAVMLLGLLVTVLRRDALRQTIGLFSAETGLMLAAINLPGPPFIALLALGALALPAAVLAGVVRLSPRGDLASLEPTS